VGHVIKAKSKIPIPCLSVVPFIKTKIVTYFVPQGCFRIDIHFHQVAKRAAVYFTLSASSYPQRQIIGGYLQWIGNGLITGNYGPAPEFSQAQWTQAGWETLGSAAAGYGATQAASAFAFAALSWYLKTEIAALFFLGALGSTFPIAILLGGIGFWIGVRALTSPLALEVGDLIYDGIIAGVSALANLKIDPLVIDLDNDGIELAALGNAITGSQVHFDFGNDGFAERTGWVMPDDGILVHDKNGNGLVDNAGELFGSVSVDGFDVLAVLDSNGDGKISEADAKFAQLRIWRDLNQNGAVDAGEMQTLAQAGLASISVQRTDVTGTNQGHDRGFEAVVTRTNGTTTKAETVYFQTDKQNTTTDNTPGFTPAPGVDKLPQLPGSGQINSIASKATTDATFMAAWTALTDAAGTLTPTQLQFGTAANENLYSLSQQLMAA
jgi:hypothetical protein